MFRAVPMVHLQVQVPSRDGPAVTRQIATQGLLHLIDIAHGAGAGTGAAADARALLAKFRDLARTARRVADQIGFILPDPVGGLPPASDAGDFDSEYRQLADRFEPIRAEVETVARRLTAARDLQARTETDLACAERLFAAGVETGRIAPLRFVNVRLGYAKPDDLAALAALVAPAPFAVVPLDSTLPRPLAAIVVPATGRERLETALRVSAFEPIEVAADTADRTPDALRQTLDGARLDEESAGRELATLRDRVGPLLAEAAARADVAVLLLQAQTMFATSGRFLVISGWIPEERAAELAAAITRVSGGRAVITIDKPGDLPAAYAATLTVPILHRNPLLLRPFDRLVRLYGVPSYGEIQPTAFFAIGFLLMFGLMFGDVGHGLVLVSAGYYLFRYMPRFLDYAILLMEAGAASAAFGVLYGSVFGVESLLPAVWLHPIRDLPRFVAIAVGFGILVVSAGLALNIVNSWRAGERLAALTSVRGLSGAFVYWVALALAARVFLPVAWTLPDAAILALVAVAAALLAGRPLIVRALHLPATSRTPDGAAAPRWLAALEASVELVDAIFAYFANTISFVRVAAFAAVHAGVFVAIFALADTFATFRFGGLFSVAVLVAGNVAVILLEGLTITVQVLRLEYYEFFGKFFRGGGELYRPLMLRPNGIQGGT